MVFPSGDVDPEAEQLIESNGVFGDDVITDDDQFEGIQLLYINLWYVSSQEAVPTTLAQEDNRPKLSSEMKLL